jgi:ADP-ribosylglycohydrolase
MLGLAVGDAVGTTVEFRSPGSFEPVTGMIGGGPFRLKPGEWTDDTSMALCLAESLIEVGTFDPVDQLGRYVRWWKHGHLSSTGSCFDIGNTVSRALNRFLKTGEQFCGATDPTTAGNGSLMRLAPIALFFAADVEQALDRAADSSRTTHAAPAAIDACRYFAGLLVGALRSTPKEELLMPRYSPVPGYFESHALIPEVDEIARGSFLQREPPEIVGSGYVVRSLEAALWAFHRSRNFKEGCLLAVNLGDDADTTGAIYGQLAGAYYGEYGIPEDWRVKLAQRELIEAIAAELFRRQARAD